jgi:hypothetical protein
MNDKNSSVENVNDSFINDIISKAESKDNNLDDLLADLKVINQPKNKLHFKYFLKKYRKKRIIMNKN